MARAAVTPAAFVTQFWEHMRAPLTRLVVAHARCIAAGVECYTAGSGAVMAYAWQHGAAWLADTALHDLEDWIAARLSAAIETAIAAGWDEWLERNRITGGRV